MKKIILANILLLGFFVIGGCGELLNKDITLSASPDYEKAEETTKTTRPKYQMRFKPRVNEQKLDVLYIQLNADYEDFVGNIEKLVVTEVGISSIDKLNDKYNAKLIKWQGYYCTFPKETLSSKSLTIMNRLKQKGYDRFFKLYFEKTADLQQLKKEYAALNEIEYADIVYLKPGDSLHNPQPYSVNAISGNAPDNLLIDDESDLNNTNTAKENLTAEDTTIEYGEDITFKGGESITLLPGFVVEEGAEFTAVIDPEIGPELAVQGDIYFPDIEANLPLYYNDENVTYEARWEVDILFYNNDYDLIETKSVNSDWTTVYNNIISIYDLNYSFDDELLSQLSEYDYCSTDIQLKRLVTRKSNDANSEVDILKLVYHGEDIIQSEDFFVDTNTYLFTDIQAPQEMIYTPEDSENALMNTQYAYQSYNPNYYDDDVFHIASVASVSQFKTQDTSNTIVDPDIYYDGLHYDVADFAEYMETCDPINKGDLVFVYNDGGVDDSNNIVEHLNVFSHVGMVFDRENPLQNILDSNPPGDISNKDGPDFRAMADEWDNFKAMLIRRVNSDYLTSTPESIVNQAGNLVSHGGDWSNIPYFYTSEENIKNKMDVLYDLAVWANKDDTQSMYCSKFVYHTFKPYMYGYDMDSNVVQVDPTKLLEFIFPDLYTYYNGLDYFYGMPASFCKRAMKKMLENSVDYTLGEYGLKPSSFVLPEDVYFSDAVQDGETILSIDGDVIGDRISESM